VEQAEASTEGIVATEDASTSTEEASVSAVE